MLLDVSAHTVRLYMTLKNFTIHRPNSSQLSALSLQPPPRRTAGLNVDVTVVDHSQTSHHLSVASGQFASKTLFRRAEKRVSGLTSGKRAVGAPIPTAGSLASDAFFTDADALLQRVSPRTAQSPRAEKRVSGLNVNVTCGGQFTDEGASDTA